MADTERSRESAAPSVSIIIRTFNEERHLPDLLTGIADQDYTDHEIVVVDSGSFDRTLEIARDAGVRLVQIRSEDFTFGYSLNSGIAEANGRIMVIVSAHTIPTDRSWLAALVAPFDDPDVVMVYGCQRGTPESKFGERLDFLRVFGETRHRLDPPRVFANNANSAILRGAWEEHPFDEALPGLEDAEWAQFWLTRGKVVTYEPAACIYHIHRETWRQVRHRYFREAVAARAIGVKGPVDSWVEALWEVRRLAGDLKHFIAGGLRGTTLADLIRFRWEKVVGTFRGLRTETNQMMAKSELYFDRTFAAVSILSVGRAEIVERPLAELKPSEILIEVAYTGICGTDLEILNGSLEYFHDGRSSYPITPGHEFSGRIAAMGARVEQFEVGDSVVADCIQGCGSCEACQRDAAIACDGRAELGVMGLDGAYAEYVTVQARHVHRIPSGISLKKAVLTEPLAVVLKGLRKLDQMDSGAPDVVVVGAGPIGLLSALELRRRGSVPVVVERDPGRAAGAKGLGLQVVDRVRNAPAALAFIEATGNGQALEDVLTDSPVGSTVLLLGLPYDGFAMAAEALVTSDRAVVGSVGSGHSDFDAALRTLPELDVDFLLENALPLAEVERAWETHRSRRVPKVLLEIGRW